MGAVLSTDGRGVYVSSQTLHHMPHNTQIYGAANCTPDVAAPDVMPMMPLGVKSLLGCRLFDQLAACGVRQLRLVNVSCFEDEHDCAEWTLNLAYPLHLVGGNRSRSRSVRIAYEENDSDYLCVGLDVDAPDDNEHGASPVGVRLRVAASSGEISLPNLITASLRTNGDALHPCVEHKARVIPVSYSVPIPCAKRTRAG